MELGFTSTQLFSLWVDCSLAVNKKGENVSMERERCMWEREEKIERIEWSRMEDKTKMEGEGSGTEKEYKESIK